MGPEFPLQRTVVKSQGYDIEPIITESAECQTLHLKHPDYRQKGRTTLPLISESYEEPGQCENSE